jgi:K+-transporting ATPase ATPase C chain
MSASVRNTGRVLLIAARMMLLFTIVLGVAYPLVITGIGQLVFPGRANGSLVYGADGAPAGSELIGQSFSDAAGNPLPEYFQPRPSVAGAGYDPKSSSGSNLGPESPELIAAIKARRAQVARFNGVPEARVPADAVTASGSGLDPDISPAYARIQIDRVARARGLTVPEVAVTTI